MVGRMWGTKKPILSIIVIFHNMRREADRTLFSLSTNYQIDLTRDDYEVIVIDNGSDLPLSAVRVQEFGSNFKYHFFTTESVSPVDAINFGVDNASGKFVAVIVDGARMVTPGLVSESLRALRLFANPFVCALAWHLGPDVQNRSISEGYDQKREDQLLDSIDWMNSGYRLFEISTLAQSSKNGFLGGMPSECSWLAMPRSNFVKMGGFDKRFQSPGGGLVNHDFLYRILSRPETHPVVLLGEGSFHQIHGGVASNAPHDKHPLEIFKAEYVHIHGKFDLKINSTPYYLGQMPDAARKFIH